MISFVLLNDDDKPLDTSEASWRLIIDGREVGDSGIVFGNGLGPIGGWKTLNPGATAEFRKGLDADKYDLNRRTGPDANGSENIYRSLGWQHDHFRAGEHYETHAALRGPSKCPRENFDYRLVQHCNGGGSILRSAQ